ncbi:MAG: anti-sigma factor antagonist [Lachnospiraceae bacterium]|nr:anti-sigma factor antagonist [Lachnospiraceae bacterium]
MNHLYLYLLHIETVKTAYDIVLGKLSPEQRVKAGRYLKEENRLLSMAGAYLTGTYAAPFGEITLSAEGKPTAPNGYFNLSHSEDLAALLISRDHEVGLDLEKERPMEESLRGLIASEEEAASEAGTLSLFVAKESLLKAVGSGLTDDLKNVPAFPADGELIYQGRSCFRHSVAFPGYRVCAVQQEEDFTLETIRIIGIEEEKNLEVKITREEDKALVAINGRLDTVTSEELRKELEKEETQNCDLDLDFTEVEYISSAGLRLLVALQRQAMSTGHTMVVRNINKVVKEVFRVSGFEKAITVL